MNVIQRFGKSFGVAWKLAGRKNFNFNDWQRAWLRGDDLPLTGYVDDETAMTYTAVFACCKVLSETIASLPMKIYKRLNPEGDKEAVTNIPAYTIVHNAPNSDMSPMNFKECLMMSLCLRGNAYAQKLYNKDGEVVQLIPINPDRVRIDRLDDKEKTLIYHVQLGKTGTETVDWTRKEMLHVPGLSYDGIVGLSPISYAARAVRLGLSYEEFGVNFFKNGANSSVVFQHPTTLSEPAYERLKKSVDEKYTGLANTGRPIIAEEGMKVESLSISQADAQYLESKRFQTEEIARMYRVPLHMLQDLTHATFSNVENLSLQFVIYSLLPWVKRIEENFNLQLLTETQRSQGLFTETSMDALLRGDTASRYTAYTQGRQWGWLSANDVRRLENKNSIGAIGDHYLEPMNMVSMTPETAKAIALEIHKLLSGEGGGP